MDFPDSSIGKETAWVGKFCWRKDRLPTPVFLGFPCGSTGKESTCNAGDPVLIPGLGRSPGEGKGYPLQYSGLENFMDGIVHRVTKSWIQLNDFHFHFSVHFVTQSCLTLCSPMDCSLPGSNIHAIFQARILKWVAISFSRGSC